MSKKLIAVIFLAVSLACTQAAAQQYQAPEVKISQDKVRVNGKSYYAHVVTEKQTLFSISKAYSVSLQDIYDANKNLDLENAGLKVGQVIFIPTSPSASHTTEKAAQEQSAASNQPAPTWWCRLLRRLVPAPLWSLLFRRKNRQKIKRIPAARLTVGFIPASTAHLPVQKEMHPLPRRFATLYGKMLQRVHFLLNPTR